MVSLLKLQKHELKDMAKLMSEAFCEHTNFAYLLPQKHRRLQATYYLFLSLLSVINRYGYIFILNEKKNRIGLITYLDDSKHKVNLFTMISTHSLKYFILFLWFSGFRNLLKFQSYMKLYNKAHKHKNPNSIHLYQAAISKEYRGQGIMKKAMVKTFDYWKDLGYHFVELETSDPDNNPIYLHLGFEVVNTISTNGSKQEIYFFKKDIR